MSAGASGSTGTMNPAAREQDPGPAQQASPVPEASLRPRGASLAVAIVLGLVMAVGTLVIFLLPGRRPQDAPSKDAAAGALPVLVQLPDFRLLDQAGNEVTLSTLAGKVWVASFIFTRCGETCPQMTLRFKALAEVLHAAPDLREQVRLVSFSVDPLRDTPRDLQEYAASRGANLSIWSFLTGQEGAVSRLCAEGFRLPLQAGSASAPDAIHSDRFVLVDRAGALRGYYAPLQDAAEMERLQRDLRRLVLEERHGS